MGKEFMAMCEKKGVDVEYEIHALSYLLPRSLYETHPEYFREKEDGERDPEYNLCFSSEEAIEAMRPQIEKLLEWMHPTTHRYFFWPDDGQGMCFCPQCRELSNADQCLLYENRLLSILKEYDPEATLSHLAYFQAIDAPTKIRASKDIFLEFAPISRNYEEPLPLTSERALRKNLPAYPGRTNLPLETLDFRPLRFSRNSRYSFRHSHFPAVHQCFRSDFAPQATLPYPVKNCLSFGCILSPVKFSAQRHSTSELLRTL